MAGSRARGPVTGTEQAEPAQAGRVVPTQGTRSFLHPRTGQGEKPTKLYSIHNYSIKRRKVSGYRL